MESDDFEDRFLNTFENVFTENDLKILGDYNIFTAGEFIGAVKGFYNIIPIKTAGVLSESIDEFKKRVPVDIIEKYLNYNDDKPMGERS